MPAKDPKTGRPLSGAAKRKRAAGARTTSYVKRAAKMKTAAPASSPTAADFDRLPPAPIGDPATAIAWTNDVLLIALDQVLRDLNLPNPERWRWIKDFGGALGHLRDKAAEQAAIKRAMADQVTAVRAQGTVSASGRTKTAVQRPSS